MKAEFKSTQRFVPRLVGILLQMAKIGHFALKSIVFNHFNVYFQQNFCFTIIFGLIQIFIYLF